MAWQDPASIEVTRRIREFWELEYKTYTEEFIETWYPVPEYQKTLPGHELAFGKNVVRRILVRETVSEWPGLTEAAANAKRLEYLTNIEYMGAESTLGAGGNHTVTTTRRQYHPDGWSDWIDAESLPGFGSQ